APVVYAADPGEPAPLADDATPEFVTITIEYERWEYHYDVDNHKYVLENMGEVFSSYIATLQYNSEFKTPISVPSILGFKSTFENTTAYSFELSDDGKQLTPNIDNVTEDIKLKIKFVPDSVDYEVRYLFQNIYDDMYVTDATLNDAENGIVKGVYKGKGYTGLPPYFVVNPDGSLSESDEKIGVYAEFEGFTALYYQPDTIAADGSTVFEVYYERNYYLMEFDCDGGYGAHTIYARHGTYVYVPTPNKMGYVLNDANGSYWDLTTTSDLKNPPAIYNSEIKDKNGKLIGYNVEDGIGEALPAEMPPYNTSYKALWRTTDTTYTVVYWIDNGDGTQTYIGSRVKDAESSTKVSGSKDLTEDMDICGLDAHNHATAGCTYACGLTEHTHGDGSCTCPVVPHTHDGVSCDYSECDYGSTPHTHDITCYKPSNNSYTTNPTSSDHLYRISRFGTGIAGYVHKYCAGANYHNYFYDGTTWYYLGTNKEYCGLINNLKNPDSIGGYTSAPTTKTISCGLGEHTHTSDCCNIDIHTHDATCCTKSPHNHATSGCRYSCGKVDHVHSNECKVNDLQYLDFVGADGDKPGDEDDITVEGDASSIVNVYYKYKEYKFKFYYAKEEIVNGKSSYYVCGNTTEFANGTANDIANQLSRVSGNWGQVKALPTLTDTGDIDVSELYTLKYDEFTTGTRYHYFTISFKYNEDISKKWPVGIFNDAETAWTFDYGNYACFSAWNVDSNSWYDNHNGNKTLKGNYQRLDYKLLIENNPNDTELNYLAFWENGTTGLGWNKAHRWTYNVYIPDANGTYQRPNDMTYKVESGQSLPASSTKYSLYGSYKVYDNNGSNNGNAYCEQTPTALEGYKLCFYGVKDLGVYNTTYDLHNYQIDFYYSVEEHNMKFYNYNSYLQGGTGAVIPYNKPLKIYGEYVNAEKMQSSYYPNGLEPNAYEFKGWYTSPGCIPGTEVDWETETMPDANFTVYANWEPIIRNVYFHLLYTDINYDDIENSNFWYPDDVPVDKRDDYYPIKVDHGSLLETAYSHTPKRIVDDEEYQFIGWFYFDENGKKKFAPDSMKVTRDLILFAEWFSTSTTQYEIEYKAYNHLTDTVIDDEIAKPLNDYSSAGKTMTFNAKGGDAMYDKTASGGYDYRSHWFPHTSSHSILMDEDSDKNTFLFKYYYKEKVNYKVMYINRINGAILGESGVKSTPNAIVTERFRPFSGYIPEEYYIQHSVAYDPIEYEGDNLYHVSDENIIYFYYVPDTEHALYRIEHYHQNADDDDYTLFTAEQGPHDINDVALPITSIEEVGFVLSKVVILTYPYNDETKEYEEQKQEFSTEKGNDLKPYESFEMFVQVGGLTVEYYYDRIMVDYSVKYV
ncbi:MAG: InlB B-repeat-containing protein, partial [Clostridia bacterium]|nr:InlB B-repeat-containing protein [Clostridia bacterium]